MGAKLHIQPKDAPAFEVRIGNTASIGRTRENTVCLNFSPLVSRQHALIRCHSAFQYQVIDLGSRNGTYVNDQRVVMPVILEAGARIRIAENTLTFIEEEEEDDDMDLTVAATTAGAPARMSRSVAMLVCDIRGFSAMSERLPSGDLAQLLGLWFREASNLVQRGQGTIDKFIGDALLAYWAGPAQCDAVFTVARQLLHFAGGQKWPGGEPFRIALALHYGPATFSDMGLSAERDATIIGDSVNTVFRLEAVAKELDRPVVLSSAFVDQLTETPPLEDFGPRTLKGKSQTVRVFALAE
jgi:adenylate cyclase